MVEVNTSLGERQILIKAGIIKNDGWNEVNSITHKFEVDKKNPRVEIEVHELD